MKITGRIFAAMLVAGLAIGAAQAQDDELRIVVLEGEDSVNIIAQGTAVPTLVEVRDRNDLPVAGANVVFLLQQGGTATLNAGLSQVAVTTNVLGQAAVTVNPIASGAVQLQVSAAFQGQTATAAIVQSNFATVAEAAAAGAGATGGGGGGGGGGGASAAGGAGGGAGGGIGAGTVLGVVGAGVGAAVAGAVVATRAEPCTFSVSTTSFDLVVGNGDTLFVNVTASPVDCSPADWTAQSNSSFISISPSSGMGDGTVTLIVGQNGRQPRDGTVSIAGHAVSVFQDAAAQPCDEQVRPGGDAPETHRIGLGRFNGRFNFYYDTYRQEDRMIVRYEGSRLYDTGCVGASGTRTLSFSGRSSIVEVEVIPNCRGGYGTAWEFSVSCARP